MSDVIAEQRRTPVRATAMDRSIHTPPRHPSWPQPVSRDEVVWSLTKDGQTYRADLRERGEAGCELRLVLNNALQVDRLFRSREVALADAMKRRKILGRKGWIAG